ncbi:MAG: DUF1294 domain-containing protein [Thiovulaceae bacterium]|nr:DUF1294 domain-containing protein [Sulfurimonadaceae bacterium]
MNTAFIRYALLSAIAFALLFFLLRYRLHFIILWAYLLGVNGVGFSLYALDKLTAKIGWLRVPESLLQLMALLGATPGSIAAQQLFWHKTTKRSFQVLFWLIVLLQIIVIYLAIFTDLLQSIF